MSSPSYSAFYYQLIPPTRAAREAGNVAWWFLFMLLLLGLLLEVFPIRLTFWRETISDLFVVDALVATGSFVILLIIATSRLTRYRHSARGLSRAIYIALVPWTLGLLLSATVLFVSINRDHYSLRQVFIAEFAPLIAYQVPGVKNWLSKAISQRYVVLYAKTLPVALGPGWHEDLAEHARDVFNLQYMFDEAPTRPSTEEQFRLYSSATTLTAFQRTLSCIYETAWHVGGLISASVESEWTLLDIGGGEGTFTCEALAHIVKPPASLCVIEPSQESLAVYVSEIERRFENIKVIDQRVARVEDALEDLPTSDICLASHSLYWLADKNRTAAAKVLEYLIERCVRKALIIVMASKKSPLYEVKKEVLTILRRRPDASSFGEDLLLLLPRRHVVVSELRDSIVDLSSVIDDPRRMINWISYFCRVSQHQLREHVPQLQKILRAHSVRKDQAPEFVQRSIEASGIVKRLEVKESSPLIFHKELVIKITGIANP